MENNTNLPTQEADESVSESKQYEIIGVRFKEAGKIYFFSPANIKFNVGDGAIVETSRGIEFGTVAVANKTVEEKDVVLPLKSVVRRATDKDLIRVKENLELAEKAKVTFREKVIKHNIDMVLVDAEYTFDNSKLLFYFTSEGRVDFREFVKDMASVFKTRIELRQIGVRDEAKQLGGLGICGRPFCCKTFLNDFEQVSIKMAKDQGLSLNSVKISGTCGRLMCCLRYENDTYQEELAKTPKVGNIVSTPSGKGVVVEANPLAGIVKVSLDSNRDAAPAVFIREDVKVLAKGKKDDIPDDDELKKLEKE
jgi:cell fate regulator YaaT (PSP1 superfamily)